MKESEIIKKILKDPRVQEISDERGMDDGFWIYLKSGWIDPIGSEAHHIHEDTPAEAYKYLKWIAPCDCCSECEAVHKVNKNPPPPKVPAVLRRLLIDEYHTDAGENSDIGRFMAKFILSGDLSLLSVSELGTFVMLIETDTDPYSTLNERIEEYREEGDRRKANDLRRYQREGRKFLPSLNGYLAYRKEQL